MVLEAIKYRKGSLEVLDQLQLPHQIHYDEVTTSEGGWRAIREMRVRGAPAIAMVGILSLAVEIETSLKAQINDMKQAVSIIDQKLDYIVTSRPTAVNLKNLAGDFKRLIRDFASQSHADVSSLFEKFQTAAAKTLEIDLRDNYLLGDHGADWILGHSPASHHQQRVNILTHCNTGSLATAGYGTALGVIRSLHAKGNLQRAYCTETRPYLQGARLTAFELVHDSIPATLVTDSMAAALMKKQSEEGNPIAAVVVGADRIAANGDTANKIGTYALAIAAKQHGVKFLVAAPCSTVDMQTQSGDLIKIEERAPLEMTTISGPVVENTELRLDQPTQRVNIAASGVDVWNPAFDVTPAKLIDGIITEKGVTTKLVGSPDGFDMGEICKR